MYNVIFGSIMSIIGAVFFICSSVTILTKKDVPIFKYLVAKSKLLFKDKAIYFYIVVGIILIVLGTLWATGIIWTK